MAAPQHEILTSRQLYMQYGNEIPTAIPMFSWFSYPIWIKSQKVRQVRKVK